MSTKPLWILIPLLAVSGWMAVGPSNVAPETERIALHLARVAEELRTSPPPDLTAEQRGARDAALDWLDEYRAGGVFPHNHVRPGQRVPVFVDPHGTPCAVGYLMLRSGAHDLVEEIVRTDNLVRVADLAADERVVAWLDAHGLTLGEAARIQPMYEGMPGAAMVHARYERPLTVGVSIATAALVSYMALSPAEHGAPWADALAVGTSVGHAALLVSTRNNASDDAGWVVGLNVAGLLAGTGAVVLRALSRSEDGASELPASGVQAFMAPGRHGTEVGLSLRH